MVDINVNYGGFYIGDLIDAWKSSTLDGVPTATHFELVDPLTGRRLEFTGMNFEPAAAAVPTIGVIENIAYYNHDGSPAWTMRKLHMSVAEFQAATAGSAYATPGKLEAFLGQTGFNFEKGFHFKGSIGDDIFNGGYGADIIRGGDGVDQISGGFQSDVLSGGGRDLANPREMDVLTYATETGGDEITVDLSKGTVIDTSGFTDKISGFEIIIGTTSADTFIAGDKNVFHGFVGGLGNDVFEGGKGGHDAVFFDRLNTGAVVITASGAALTAIGSGIGSDTLTNIDIIVGSAVNDVMTGTSAKETFTGGNGIDTLDGGGGSDTLDFSYETGTFGAVASLEKQIAIDTFHSGLGASSIYVEHVTNFENVVGSEHDDFITGEGGKNRLDGGDGEDELRGLAGSDVIGGGVGNDWLEGGKNRDILTGGAGADIFVFRAGDTGIKASKADLIKDFDVEDGDKIDLSAIDANPGKDGQQTFDFIGEKGFDKGAGHVRIHFEGKDTWIYASTDNDRSPELAIHLDGHIKLTADDFYL